MHNKFIWRSLFMILIVAATGSALPPKITKSQRITFRRGQTETVLVGKLKPYTRHRYRFRAQAGQQMSVRLELPEEDIMFSIQSTRPMPNSESFIMPGITKNGVTDWYGELPTTQDYEIYVFNPRFNDHPVKRALGYKIRLTIK